MKTKDMTYVLNSPHRTVWLSLLLALGIMLSWSGQTAYAQYADGSGQGKYQNQIYWLEWDGFNFTNGQSRTFNLPGNVTVTATVSNISGGAVSIGRPEDYGPAAMNLAYPNTGRTAINSCTACTNRFRLAFTANVAGTSVPVDLVVADAEAAASNEYLKVTSDGNPWQLLEQFQAQNLRATFSNGDKSLELHGNGATTYGTVLAVSTNVTNFDFELKGGGISAAALGIFLPSDYGDAPTSFGDAGHYVRQVFAGGLPGATKVYDPVSTAFTNFATISDAPTVFLGPIKPDADPGSQNTGADATTALGDNLDNTNDEDGVATFPPFTPVTTSYAVNVTAHNTSGSPATLWGWVDFNGDGQFAAAEAASATVANGSNPASVSLNWPAVTVTPPASGISYARFRIATGALTDNGTTAQDERAQGGASDGEVEDYAILVLDFGDAPKDMSSIDASLSNAYPTLLADNGPRHSVDPAIRLGALIDVEVNGQPNRAADGDDVTTTDDEDGVTFNPALGITTANVVLSGAQNTLGVSASTAGFLSAWIDYNQNGTFTDAGEQLFNDQLVTAGANTLTFTTPNTAPHGATYMRFRYSTQSGVANTVTGFAPDGEVEDYRVAVALPAPQSCAAGLVNGSFELPVVGVTPPTPIGGTGGWRTYRAADVPGWGFVPTSPSAANNFDERHAIEIWQNGYQGVAAYQGNQLAEINGYTPGNLYQDVLTVPGSTLAWTVAHRGLRGTDVMAIKIGAPGATVTQRTVSDGNTQWAVYSGSYVVPAGQTITRFEFQAVSSTGNAPDSGNLVDAISFSLPCDYADAPDTYGTTSGANGANHVIAGTLKLGSLTDAEGTGFPSVNASGDNLNNLNDEDSLAALPSLNQASTAYTLGAIPVLNNTGSAVTLYGWVDFNRNGQFDAGERTSASVPTNASQQSVVLSWSGLSGLVPGQSYLRLRLSDQANVQATGAAGAGEVEDYPLTIAQPGTLVVQKNTTGGDGSFVFSSQTLPTSVFTLTTVGGTARRTFTNLLPGTYNVAETVPVGWDLTGVVCTGGRNPNSMTIGAGETVTCVFTDVKRGSLTVVKQALGHDRAFDFSSQALGSFTLTTTNGTGRQSFPNLPQGTYNVTETVPGGWQLDSATCSDGSNPNSIAIGPGENVTCTFVNEQLDTIILVKRALGGDAVFPFAFGTLTTTQPFSLTTVNGLAQSVFSNLGSGTYGLTETVPLSWTLISASCSDGSDPSSINLSIGETVVCVFINLKQDTIIVEKQTVGGEGTFPFTSTIPGAASFALTTSSGITSTSIAFSGLPPTTTYSIVETTPAGWDLSAGCDNGDTPDSVSLAPGETVKCTFVNTKRGSLTIAKYLIGTADASFVFTSTTLPTSTLSLTTDQGFAQQTIGNLRPGVYDVSEVASTGSDLVLALCNNGDTPDRVTVEPGEDVACGFLNFQRGSLTVVKHAVSGDGSFDFVSPQLGNFSLTTTVGTAQQLFPNLVLGTYAITETVPVGWDLTGAICDNGDNPANITILPGDDITCIFENTKRGSLTIVAHAAGGDGSFGYTSQVLGTFSLTTTAGAAQQSFSDLVSGVYDVSQLVPANWRLDNVSCSDGSNPASINIVPGKAVTCIFSNVYTPTALEPGEEPNLQGGRIFLPLLNR